MKLSEAIEAYLRARAYRNAVGQKKAFDLLAEAEERLRKAAEEIDRVHLDPQQ